MRPRALPLRRRGSGFHTPGVFRVVDLTPVHSLDRNGPNYTVPRPNIGPSRQVAREQG
jgi:hypothetical protein